MHVSDTELQSTAKGLGAGTVINTTMTHGALVPLIRLAHRSIRWSTWSTHPVNLDRGGSRYKIPNTSGNKIALITSRGKGSDDATINV